MRVRQIPISPMSVADRERWQDLADRAVEPNPFFEPAFAQLAAERLGERGTSLLVVEDAGGWNACLPVQSAKVVRVVPALRTWMHLYCFLGTPLLAPGAIAPAAARMLLEAATESRRVLLLESLVEGRPAAVALSQAADALGLVAVRERRHHRALLERREGGGYLDGQRSHHRRELNRLARRLESELGGPISVSDESSADAAFGRFLELEPSG